MWQGQNVSFGITANATDNSVLLCVLKVFLGMENHQFCQEIGKCTNNVEITKYYNCKINVHSKVIEFLLFHTQTP